jgi:hypothetical protein
VVPVVFLRTNGYGPKIGQTPQGYPIYPYTDPDSKVVSYVVVLPDGRAFYSDAYGNIGRPGGEVDAEVAGAIVTGTLGALTGGPVGAVVGAIAGAIVGKLLKKQAA